MPEIGGVVMVIDVVGAAIVSWGVGFLASSISRELRDKKKPKEEKIIDDGSIPFTYNRGDRLYGVEAGFVCPKCGVKHIKKAKDHIQDKLQICECPEYPNLHFHWLCPTCGFKAIMRTADSK